MNYTLEQIEPMLMHCEKPARYTGCERNIIVKKDPAFRGGISYPDLYEIGMANSGVQILYEKANALDGVAIERVYAPALDFFEQLKSRQMRLYTLESYTPLCELDSLSFNAAHELLYTNIAYMLDAGGIQMRASERTGGPIVIMGGEAVSNPAPLSVMADIIFAGEGDEGYAELIAYLAECKSKGLSRQETLAGAESIAGVLVPSIRTGQWSSSGMRVLGGDPVKRRLYHTKNTPSSIRPIVPTLRTGHERATMEISRGCYNLCKFCHAGYYQLPFRLYDAVDIRDKTFELYKASGYSTVGYNSLSISDCSTLAEIMNEVLPWMNEQGLSMSLPSMKVDLSTLPIIEALSGIRRASLTFAIETANEELRKCIHKRVSIEDVISIVTHVVEKGWRTIKFYFMLGLPGYTEHDEIDSMIALLSRILSATRNRASINVTLSPFIPKPHTPFQYADMAPLEYFQNAVFRIKREVSRKIAVKNHNIRASMVEAFLARGDLRVGDAIIEAYSKGCCFDSWDEHFKAAQWFEVMKAYNKNEAYFRGFSVDGKYSWHIIDTGRAELINALSQRRIPPAHRPARYAQTLNTGAFSNALRNFERKYNQIGTMIVTLKKQGVARFVSHLDMLEVLRRALRIAGIPAAFSQGFNKIERIVSTQPLTLGVESICEMFAIDLYAPYDNLMCEALKEALPQGFSVTSVEFRQGVFKNFAFNSADYMVYFRQDETHRRFMERCKTDCMLSKNTKHGERTFALSECLRSCENVAENSHDNRKAVLVRLFTEGPFAFRVDMLVRQLLECDPFESATIVKVAQSRIEG